MNSEDCGGYLSQADMLYVRHLAKMPLSHD